MNLGACLKKIHLVNVWGVLIASKLALFFGIRFERRKVDKKQTYMKNETCKLYSRDF